LFPKSVNEGPNSANTTSYPSLVPDKTILSTYSGPVSIAECNGLCSCGSSNRTQSPKRKPDSMKAASNGYVNLDIEPF